MNKHIAAMSLSVATVAAVVAVLSPGTEGTSAQNLTPLNASLGSVAYAKGESTMQERIAQRLQKRIRVKTSGASPTVQSLTKAIEQRQQLLKSSVTVEFTGDEQVSSTWEASVAKYPLWLIPQISLTDTTFTLDEYRVLQTLEQEKVIDLPAPEDVTLTAVRTAEETGDVIRAETTGTAKPGYVVDKGGVAKTVVAAMNTNQGSVEVPLELRGGAIINQTGLDLGKLELWATGKSDFAGSDYGRKANVRFALREKVHNTIVAPGETFSFNDTLGGPVTQSRGWSMAKVIFNGGDLELAPGGGICQASTTTYRAILNAGFPVTERAAHSLYVSYYAAHGVGIDATIFPGKQDLEFVNDSGNYLLIQSYDDGTEAYVHIYGTPDGRTSTLEGPYFITNAPADLTYKGRSIRGNEILWKQHVVYPDGRTENNMISSQYNKGIPRYVMNQYGPEVPKDLHASAQ